MKARGRGGQSTATGSAGSDTLGDELQRVRAALDSLQAEVQLAVAALRDDIRKLEHLARYESAARILRNWTDDADDLSAHEARVLSQNGEDGVLAEILRRLGRRRGRFVEIGAHAEEANCLFLADALGFGGAFIDADAAQVARLQRKYASRADVRLACARVTAKNVHELLGSLGVQSEFDVLSIDIDGNDYWIWRALTDYSPAVVVIEHNAALPAGKPVVQRYDEAYEWDGTNQFGASRLAMIELGRSKGYRLVHTDLTGVNLFFVMEQLWPSEQDDAVVRPPNYFFRLLLHPQGDPSRLKSTPEAEEQDQPR